MNSLSSRYHIRLLVILLGLMACGPSVADPDKFALKMKGLVKGNPSVVAKKVSGFYMDKESGYFSYVYVEVENGKFKGAYDYKEDGERHQGYLLGEFDATQGVGRGSICYLNPEEWLADVGIAFSEKRGKTQLRIFYTEDAGDNKWKNDWGHTRKDFHPQMEKLKKRLKTEEIKCR